MTKLRKPKGTQTIKSLWPVTCICKNNCISSLQFFSYFTGILHSETHRTNDHSLFTSHRYFKQKMALHLLFPTKKNGMNVEPHFPHSSILPKKDLLGSFTGHTQPGKHTALPISEANKIRQTQMTVSSLPHIIINNRTQTYPKTQFIRQSLIFFSFFTLQELLLALWISKTMKAH